MLSVRRVAASPIITSSSSSSTIIRSLSSSASSSTAAASRPAPTIRPRGVAFPPPGAFSTPAVGGSGSHSIPASAFAARINSAAEDLRVHRLQSRKNVALGLALVAGVVSVWAYSVHMVTAAKDAFTTPEVEDINRELDREEKIAAAQAAKATK